MLLSAPSSLRVAAFLLGAALLSPLPTAQADDERGPGNERGGAAKKKADECVAVTQEAIYRNYGYDHIVHFHNDCGEAVTCTVSTDANPEATTVSIEKGDKASVVTFRGSPARTFKPSTQCAYRK